LAAQTQDLFHWKTFPLIEKRKKAFLAFALVLLALICIYAATRQWFWVLIAALFLAFDLRSFFFPTNYSLSEEGIEIVTLGMKRKKPFVFTNGFYILQRSVLTFLLL